MDFSSSSFFAALFVSAVGFVLFRYGKAQQRLPHLITGLLLMVFPYFVPGVVPMIAVAAAMVGALWFATRVGY
jgi:hypothetical protein